MKRLAVVGIALAILGILLHQPRATAAGPCTVPQSWGPLKTALSENAASHALFFVFEDEAGTIRVLNRNKCEPWTDREVVRTK